MGHARLEAGLGRGTEQSCWQRRKSLVPVLGIGGGGPRGAGGGEGRWAFAGVGGSGGGGPLGASVLEQNPAWNVT